MVLPKLTLTYFHFTGRAEPIRLAAAIGKVPFIHRAIAPKDWPSLKPTVPLGQIPVLEVEDEASGEKETIVQSVAILRYFGKLGGLYPVHDDDSLEALRVDSLLDTAVEATKILELSVVGPVKSLLAEENWSPEQVQAIRKRIATNPENGLPFHLTFFEDKLKANSNGNSSGWLVGEKITVADLLLHRVSSWIHGGVLDGIPAEMLKDYPLVSEHREKIENLPQVKEWRAEHPTPYTDFRFLM